MLFQFIFTLFAFVAILSNWRTGKHYNMSKRGLFLWTFVWLLALVVVWIPSTTEYVASQLGIGRGVDVVLYSTIPLLFFLLFRLHIKISQLESQITSVVREKALVRALKDKQ